MRRVTKVAGWTFAGLFVAGWAAGVASLSALECANDCPPSPFPGVSLFLLAPLTVAFASSFLAHGYGPEGGPPTGSTPAALAAKIVKLLALGPVTLMLVSPLLAMFQPIIAIVALVVFGPLAWVILRSARSLDRAVTPTRFTAAQSWGIAAAVVLAGALVTYGAA